MELMNINTASKDVPVLTLFLKCRHNRIVVFLCIHMYDINKTFCYITEVDSIQSRAILGAIQNIPI